MRVKCLAQEHNTMSPARARTRTARSGDERTNHEATVPPTMLYINVVCLYLVIIFRNNHDLREYFTNRLRRPVGRMTAEEQHHEGEFRFVNSRLITNRCSIIIVFA